jgi:hypothetical protein
MTAAEAIATVRAVRHPTAVETAEQERFVGSFRPGSQRGDRAS